MESYVHGNRKPVEKNVDIYRILQVVQNSLT